MVPTILAKRLPKVDNVANPNRANGLRLALNVLGTDAQFHLWALLCHFAVSSFYSVRPPGGGSVALASPDVVAAMVARLSNPDTCSRRVDIPPTTSVVPS